MTKSGSLPPKVVKLRAPSTAAPVQARAAHALAIEVDHLKVHAESAIALLHLLIQQVPASFPAPKDEQGMITKSCALAEAAIKTLQTACAADSVGPYLAAGAKVQQLVLQIEEGMGAGQTDEGAATCFGLTWSIEAFLRVNGFLAAEPETPSALPEPAPQAANTAAAEALSEAVNDVGCDLAYIRELSDALAEAAEGNDPNRIEALARGIALMADNVRISLDKHVDAAREASHG